MKRLLVWPWLRTCSYMLALLAVLSGLALNERKVAAQDVVAPMFIARLNTNVLEVYWWPFQTPLTATVYTDPSQSEVLATASGYADNEDDDAPGTYNEDINIPISLAAGMYVKVQGGVITKELEISNITIDAMDTQNDTISGTVNLGLTDLLVRIWSSPGHLATRLPQAVSGNWIADFSQPGPNSEWEDDTWNVVPCDYGVVRAYDVDGDSTSQPWSIASAPYSTCADTSEGDNVLVPLSSWLDVEFANVSKAGWTTVEAISDPPDVPTNFSLLGNMYEVATSAEFSVAQLCFVYDPEDRSAVEEEAVRLLHLEGGFWINVTDPGFPNIEANQVCGTVSSFSPFAIVQLNTPPANVVIDAPLDPQRIGTAVTVSATFTDPDYGDAHTGRWDWGDGATEVVPAAGYSVTAAHTYLEAGVYTIGLTVTDESGASATATSGYLVAYDPDGGFVTGGGWINSPAAAYVANPTLAGKATFGFVSKYQKGANIPTGNTEFQFRVADLNFRSTTYDWLVIAGARAQYKGSGTINGVPGYEFMLTAVDGALKGPGFTDTLRMKIVDKATGELVYDNQIGAPDGTEPETTVQGGSIVVHK